MVSSIFIVKLYNSREQHRFKNITCQAGQAAPKDYLHHRHFHLPRHSGELHCKDSAQNITCKAAKLGSCSACSIVLFAEFSCNLQRTSDYVACWTGPYSWAKDNSGAKRWPSCFLLAVQVAGWFQFIANGSWGILAVAFSALSLSLSLVSLGIHIRARRTTQLTISPTLEDYPRRPYTPAQNLAHLHKYT